MIVNASGLVLPPMQDSGPNNPVIGWRNIVTVANLAADGEDADYPASNLANPSTALKWVGADTADQYLTVTTGTSDPIDYLAVARHNFGSGVIPVTVQGKASGGDPYTDLVQETVLTDDLPVIFRFEPQALSHIRLKMEPDADEPTAAVLYVGRLLVLPRRIYVGHTPLPLGRTTRVTSGRSEAGNYLGRIITGESRESAVSLQNLKPDWYRDEMDPFVAAAQETPFFWAWRPEKYPAETGFAWLNNEPRPSNSRPNGMMSVDLQMAGIA